MNTVLIWKLSWPWRTQMQWQASLMMPFAVKVSALVVWVNGANVMAAPDAEAAVKDADIICTLTAAAEPILNGAWVAPGAHVNVVGSSHAGPVEIDNDLVARSRFIVDSRASVLEQGAEFLRAKAEGLIDDTHIAAEIGEVFAGAVEGRRSPEEITIYKSLGHVAQDLAAAALLYDGYGRRP